MPKSKSQPLSVIIGFGSTDLEDWFKNTFYSDIENIYTTIGFDDFKLQVNKGHYKIAVLMRTGPMMGLPDAEVMAEWAIDKIPAILYIAGELDQEGKDIINRLKSIGIKNILSCPVGGYISGEELVFMMHSIIREMFQDDRKKEKPGAKEPDMIDTLEIFKKSTSKLSQALKRKPDVGQKNEQTKVNIQGKGIAIDGKPTAVVYGAVWCSDKLKVVTCKNVTEVKKYIKETDIVIISSRTKDASQCIKSLRGKGVTIPVVIVGPYDPELIAVGATGCVNDIEDVVKYLS